MSVLVAAPCGKKPNCHKFYDSFYNLELPEGSLVRRCEGGSVAWNLNEIIREAAEFDYVFIVEDDSYFATDTVIKLLAHNKDVVTGLCLSRNPPFRPYIYSGWDDKLGLLWRNLTNDDKGLIKVSATGMGGILIKMSVFAKLTKPYFSIKYDGETEWGQDIVFAKKLIDAEIEVFCDLDARIYHMTDCSLSAMLVDGYWQTVVSIGGMNIKFPLIGA